MKIQLIHRHRSDSLKPQQGTNVRWSFWGKRVNTAFARTVTCGHPPSLKQTGECLQQFLYETLIDGLPCHQFQGHVRQNEVRSIAVSNAVVFTNADVVNSDRMILAAAARNSSETLHPFMLPYVLELLPSAFAGDAASVNPLLSQSHKLKFTVTESNENISSPGGLIMKPARHTLPASGPRNIEMVERADAALFLFMLVVLHATLWWRFTSINNRSIGPYTATKPGKRGKQDKERELPPQEKLGPVSDRATAQNDATTAVIAKAVKKDDPAPHKQFAMVDPNIKNCNNVCCNNSVFSLIQKNARPKRLALWFFLKQQLQQYFQPRQQSTTGKTTDSSNAASTTSCSSTTCTSACTCTDVVVATPRTLVVAPPRTLARFVNNRKIARQQPRPNMTLFDSKEIEGMLYLLGGHHDHEYYVQQEKQRCPYTMAASHIMAHNRFFPAMIVSSSIGGRSWDCHRTELESYVDT